MLYFVIRSFAVFHIRATREIHDEKQTDTRPAIVYALIVVSYTDGVNASVNSIVWF